MRNLINIVEAKRAAPAPEAFDASATYERLKAIAAKLSRHPFDISWDYEAAKWVKSKVDNLVARHEEAMRYDDEDDYHSEPLDTRDLYLEALPDAWTFLGRQTFDKVGREIEVMTREYQSRHGLRMDDDAGYEDDMHFVEDSDWLRAMRLQERWGWLMGSMFNPMSTHRIMVLTKAIEDYIGEWIDARQTDQRDEPTLTEHMVKGLAGALPLLMTVVAHLKG